MNKLKEIGNKYYQEAEVVMLATNKESNIMMWNEKGQKKDLFNFLPLNIHKSKVIYQHLYFLNNETIKEGDWYYDGFDNKIHQSIGFIKLGFSKKIIATTDTSLGLPQPSKSFIQAYIKAYNEGKPITKVLIEYEIKNISDDEGFFNLTERIKINSSNEITIKKVKDSWTREEHCTDMQYYMEYCEKNGYVTPMDWLDKFKHY